MSLSRDDQLLLAEGLPAADLDRPRVHARQRALALAVEPVVDEPRELRVHARPASTPTDAMMIAVRMKSRRMRARKGRAVFARADFAGARADPNGAGQEGDRAPAETWLVLTESSPSGRRVERQLLAQPLDERRPVLVEEVDEAEHALLRVRRPETPAPARA